MIRPFRSSFPTRCSEDFSWFVRRGTWSRESTRKAPSPSTRSWPAPCKFRCRLMAACCRRSLHKTQRTHWSIVRRLTSVFNYLVVCFTCFSLFGYLDYCRAKGRIAELSPLGSVNGFVPAWLHLLHGSLDPREAVSQTASWSVQPFLHNTSSWPTHTDRHTDHATCGICRNRPHLCHVCDVA